MISSLLKIIDIDLLKDEQTKPNVRLFRLTSVGFIPGLVVIFASMALGERLPSSLLGGTALFTVGWIALVGWRSYRIARAIQREKQSLFYQRTTAMPPRQREFDQSGLSDEELAKIWEEAERSNPKSFRQFYEFEQYEDDRPTMSFMQCYLALHRPDMDIWRQSDVNSDLTDYRARMLLKALLERRSLIDVHDYGLARNGLVTHFGRHLSDIDRQALADWITQFEREHMEEVKRAGWQPLVGHR